MRVFLILASVCFTPVIPQQSCWWSGCQPTTWKRRGCFPLEKFDQRGSRSCAGGNEYHCCLKTDEFNPTPPTQGQESGDLQSCWWSGCQPKSWGQRGCFPLEKFNQLESRSCTGGNEYRCCPKTGEDNPTPPQDEESVALESCWWSGCQPKTWKQRGCFPEEKFDQSGSRPCIGGNEYQCCPKTGKEDNPTSPTQAISNEDEESVALQSCWWSGCQPTTWKQRGCFPVEKFNPIGSRSCTGGTNYHCCPKTDEEDNLIPPTQAISGEESVPLQNCFWSGCQPTTWKQKGCFPTEKFNLIGSLACTGGADYHCCPKTGEEDNPIPATQAQESGALESCWWSGCQPKTSKQQGCLPAEKYNLIGSLSCTGGTDYHCCSKTREEDNLVPPTQAQESGAFESCWWSGCQPKTSKQQGCFPAEKYNLIGSLSCTGGTDYHCCPKSGEEVNPISVNQSSYDYDYDK